MATKKNTDESVTIKPKASKKASKNVPTYKGMIVQDGRMVPINWATEKPKRVETVTSMYGSEEVLLLQFVNKDRIFAYNEMKMVKYNLLQNEIKERNEQKREIEETALRAFEG